MNRRVVCQHFRGCPWWSNRATNIIAMLAFFKRHRSKSFFRFCEAKLSTDAEGADAMRDLKHVEICWKRYCILYIMLYIFFDASKASKIKVQFFSVQVRPSSLSKKQRRGMWPNEGQQKIAHVSLFTELSWRQRRRLKAGKEWQKWWIQMN